MKSAIPSIMASSGVSASTPKKDQKTKKPRTKPTHPRTADMVNGAIGALSERGGSSLQAIKKYMSSTYKVDADKQAPFIKRYLKTAVAGGNLVQVKGKGAAGSFKLSGSDGAKTKKRPVVRKNAPLKKAVKTATPKKTTVKKIVKKAVVKRAPAKAAAEKKKITKGPAAKPPKAKIAAKVKAAPAPKKSTKKAEKVVKAKKPVKKTAGKKK